MLLDTVSGNPFDRIVGPRTFVDIVVAAVRTLSGSTRIFGSLGMIDAKIPMTSSALSAGATSDCAQGLSLLGFSPPGVVGEALSVKATGRVVKRAVNSRRKRS